MHSGRPRPRHPVCCADPPSRFFLCVCFFSHAFLYQRESSLPKPCFRGSPRHQAHSRCTCSSGLQGAGGGGLRKELTAWRSVAVTVGLARRDKAKEEGLRVDRDSSARLAADPSGRSLERANAAPRQPSLGARCAVVAKGSRRRRHRQALSEMGRGSRSRRRASVQNKCEGTDN